MYKKVFIIVLDSLGIGNAPDAESFNDYGSNTLSTISKSTKFSMPNMQRLGLFNIDGVFCATPAISPKATLARLVETSMGKDTTIGHWEISGVHSAEPLPTFPYGFPKELIDVFVDKCGREVLCNKPYSGTAVLHDYGEEHMQTGKLIVYTSADSVFQIAAHEEIVPVKRLYEYCDIARELLQGKWGVGRVIARPFIGENRDCFMRTTSRHDVSLPPPSKTMLDCIKQSGLDVIGVGKIYDIFAGVGLTETIKTTSNANGMDQTIALANRKFNGLAFVNLVDFDMLYGHRNDIDGYAAAATEFDTQLAYLLPLITKDDLLIITADHGCDPGTVSTDHSRECVPLIMYSPAITPQNLGTIKNFGCIAATVCKALGLAERFNAETLI